MAIGFWKNLPRPFFALAPLFDVTDTVFRQTIVKCGLPRDASGVLRGKPDVMFTEFISTDGLCNEKSRDKMIRYYLKFTQSERPLVAQIWGNDPEKFFKAATLIKELGFDGVDINMGCPDKKVIACGGGVGLLEDPTLAKEIIAATKEGAGDLPVSVKTRIGFNTIELVPWLSALIEAAPAVITLHLRTRREMSKVPAHWEVLPDAVTMCHEKNILIIGNGDVRTLGEAKEKAENYGVDGTMIGRAIFNNFWFFNPIIDPETIPLDKRLHSMVDHVQLFEQEFKGVKNFSMFRKHIQNYVSGFAGAKELRMELMEAENANDTRTVVREWIEHAQEVSLIQKQPMV
jgi:tRNA-dihydrouridine synthase